MVFHFKISVFQWNAKLISFMEEDYIAHIDISF